VENATTGEEKETRAAGLLQIRGPVKRSKDLLRWKSTESFIPAKYSAYHPPSAARGGGTRRLKSPLTTHPVSLEILELKGDWGEGRGTIEVRCQF